MKTLIIYAHPRTKGFCSAILDKVISCLDESKIKFEFIDLYKIDYDPKLKAEEHYTSGGKKISEQNVLFQKKISSVDKMIIIYPIWWNSPPSILKGFFDRVLTPGFAYRFKGKIPIKLLKNKKAVVFITHGSPNFYTTLILRDRGAKVVTKDILGFCGIKSRFFKIGDCRKMDDKKKALIEKLVRRGLKYLSKD